MSKRIMTTFNALTLTFVLMTGLSAINNEKQQHLAQLSQSCMAIASNLPMNHVGHPCSKIYSPNQNIWSWLSGDSQSVYFHFLDITELIQAKIYYWSN